MKRAGWIFGVSDLVIPCSERPVPEEPGFDETPAKYQKIYNKAGELLGEVEVYMIGYASEDEV